MSRAELEELRALKVEQMSGREELEYLRGQKPVQVVEDQQIQPVDEEKSFVDKLGEFAREQYGRHEATATVASGMVAEPVAGLTGLVTAPFVGAEKAGEIIKQVRKAITLAPRTKEGVSSLKTVGDFVKSGVDLVNYPISGLAGLADIVSGEGMEQAGETVESVQEIGLGKTAGKQAMEAGHDPLVSATLETLPSAALELGGFGALRRAAKVRPAKPDAKPDIKPEIEPELKDYTEIQKNLERKRLEPTAEQVRPDKQILADADALGIELNPSAYSTNRAFIDIEQALKARPGSKLGTIEEQAIVKLGEKADDLIKDLGGTTDKSLLDFQVKDDFISTLAQLESKSDLAYQAVNSAVTPAVKIKPTAVRAHLQKVLAELGGDKSLLTSSEKKLLDLVDENKTPTYAALDRIRKDVGQGFKKSGIFKDDAEGSLKQVYKALSEDQQNAAKAFGVGEEYAAARKLVSTRKNLESTAQSLLGRDLNNSIVPKITASATALAKGDVSKFKKLMNSVPAEKRAEVASTMLNDIFASGARKKGSLGQGFVSAFEGLNRNKAAKDVLFSYLPEGAKARFDRIGRVASGIYKAKALENTSKTATAIIHAMDSGGIFNKVLSVGERLTPVPGTGTSVIGVASHVLRKTPATKAADDFLTSPAFKKAIEIAATKGPQKANKTLKSNVAFKKWLKTATPENAAQISTVGFIQWLIEEKNNVE